MPFSHEIIIHNRLLARVNGKPISVMDVKKSMDLFLKGHYPDALSSPFKTYQFYVYQWKFALQELINKELLRIEAENLKATLPNNKTLIPDGVVHEEIKKRFGANPFQKIQDLGFTDDQIEKFIIEEMMISSVSWTFVWQKAIQQVTPDKIQKEYNKHLDDLKSSGKWEYKIVTIHGDSEQDNKKTAKKLYQLISQKSHLEKDENTLTGIIQEMNKHAPSNLCITISSLISVANKDISLEIKKILEQLSPCSLSKMMTQTPDGLAYRMFYLIKYHQESPPSIQEIFQKLTNSLIQENGLHQRAEYIGKLKKKFFYEDLLASAPKNFIPFEMHGLQKSF